MKKIPAMQIYVRKGRLVAQKLNKFEKMIEIWESVVGVATESDLTSGETVEGIGMLNSALNSSGPSPV